VRIIAGRWRGRTLVAPPGTTTRPTAERMRQAIFDMLWHAPWAGRERLEGAAVLDGDGLVQDGFEEGPCFAGDGLTCRGGNGMGGCRL
jgi:hypothetical protein